MSGAGFGWPSVGRPVSGRGFASAVGLMWVAAALLISGGTRTAAAASGVELIMVEEVGCRFCRRWDAEIGHAYAKSAEGRFAPLKRVRREAPEVKGLKPVVYTPTFIVMRGGEEIGRVTGYPGRDYFWPELDEILSSIGFMRGL